ncbi:unnamed protein product [Allacma fusca]|uniref:Uncharacterized protein n=1 Tax=Allacma fusca TaxID=39272 RepID=A0A8J2JJ20_9HEXA|nr:unnamed protein product [Allacma fusca]
MFYELKCIIYNNRYQCCFLVSQLHRRLPARTNKSIFGNLFQHSLLDLMIITYPLSISSCGIGSIFWYLYDPKACQLFYSVLPEHMETPFYWALLMTVEIWFMTEMVSSAFWCGYVLLSYVGVHLTENTLGNLKNRLRSWPVKSLRIDGDEILQKFCKELQRLWVEVKLYNGTFSGLTYVMKLEMLIISIFGLFTGIRCFSRIPLLASIYLFMGVYAILMFISFFGHSFLVEVCQFSETHYAHSFQH